MPVALLGPNSGHSFTVTDGDIARFWTRVNKTDDGCWLWEGHINPSGYGAFMGSWRKGPTVAHRVAWAIANGPIPRGLSVCHTCDVRNCVRPDHLFLGTHRENMADMRAKGRQRNASPALRCRHGHYFTAANAIKSPDGNALRACALCVLLAEQDRAGAVYETMRRKYEAYVADVVSPALPSIEVATRMLPTRELDIIGRSFGVYGREPEPMTILAYMHGVSRQRIEQIRDAALLRLGVSLEILDRDLSRNFGKAAGEVNVIPAGRTRRRNIQSVVAAA